MIASAKRGSYLETVRRNGHASAREKTHTTEADLRDRAEALNQFAQILAGVIEKLVATAEVLELANVPDIELGIDFYAEIQRYELLLIQRALRQTEGSQVKAAALLKLKSTTLNSKIKHYAEKAGKANQPSSSFLLLP